MPTPSLRPSQLPAESVVLLSDSGQALGAAPKAATHHSATPLHLAFSCYLFDTAGRVLLTRRALDKSVFPGVWTNSVCGHPGPGESLRAAVARRASDELGIPGVQAQLILPLFRYRAEMNGVVENEWCPVLACTLSSAVALSRDPAEVADYDWTPWEEFARAVVSGARKVSPWCALQVKELVELGDPRVWPPGDESLLPPAISL